MHATWKPWLHCGSTRIWSPEANSDKQMAHSEEEEENLAAESSLKVSLGRELRIFFFKPLLATEGEREEGIAGCIVGGVVVEERRRSQAQRATEMRPSTQIKAQRRAAKITTKSESTVTGCSLDTDDDEDDGVTSFRNLKGRVM